MTFEEALTAMRSGQKVRRHSWGVNDLHLQIVQPPNTVDTHSLKYFLKTMQQAPGLAVPYSSVPYVLSHDDIIAATWDLVP